LYTCLQRGGQEQIDVFKEQLFDENSKTKCRIELKNVLQNLGVKFNNVFVTLI
jgi:hypothetical protein